VKTYVINKCGKFCVKNIVFLHYIDIAIFALGYFILPHPVDGKVVHYRRAKSFNVIEI